MRLLFVYFSCSINASRMKVLKVELVEMLKIVIICFFIMTFDDLIIYLLMYLLTASIGTSMQFYEFILLIHIFLHNRLKTKSLKFFFYHFV